MNFNKLLQDNQRSNFIVNNAAADRILDLPAFSTTETTFVSQDKIAVRTRDNEYELPTSAFYQDFSKSRKERSQNLLVSTTNYSNVLMVTNPENHHRYPTRTTATGIECKCRDYQKQSELLKGKLRCCKHGYRVLSHLGYSFLSDYIQANQAQLATA